MKEFAPNEVNLNAGTRRKVAAIIHQIDSNRDKLEELFPANIFDECHREVLALIELSSIPKFKKSGHYTSA